MNSLAGIDMGRILLDLSNEVIKQLDDLEVQRNLPRADLLREAVDQYLINLRNRLEPKARYGMRTAGRENWPIFSALEG